MLASADEAFHPFGKAAQHGDYRVFNDIFAFGAPRLAIPAHSIFSLHLGSQPRFLLPAPSLAVPKSIDPKAPSSTARPAKTIWPASATQDQPTRKAGLGGDYAGPVRGLAVSFNKRKIASLSAATCIGRLPNVELTLSDSSPPEDSSPRWYWTVYSGSLI